MRRRRAWSQLQDSSHSHSPIRRIRSGASLPSLAWPCLRRMERCHYTGFVDGSPRVWQPLCGAVSVNEKLSKIILARTECTIWTNRICPENWHLEIIVISRAAVPPRTNKWSHEQTDKETFILEWGLRESDKTVGLNLVFMCQVPHTTCWRPEKLRLRLTLPLQEFLNWLPLLWLAWQYSK